MIIDVTIPIETRSESNLREHWSARSKRAKSQRGTVSRVIATKQTRPVRAALGEGRSVTIVLTRIAPRSLDSDNLRGALKAVRDGVADALWPDAKAQQRDNQRGVTWEYQQQRGAVREMGVRVEVRVEDLRSPVVAAELDGADPWDGIVP